MLPHSATLTTYLSCWSFMAFSLDVRDVETRRVHLTHKRRHLPRRGAGGNLMQSPATASSAAAPICQRAAAVTASLALATATELGTASIMGKSLSESPNTATSSGVRPKARASSSAAQPLSQPVGRTSNRRTRLLGNTSESSGTSAATRSRSSASSSRERALQIFALYTGASSTTGRQGASSPLSHALPPDSMARRTRSGSLVTQ